MNWGLAARSPARLLVLAVLGTVVMLVAVLAVVGAGIAGETGLLSIASQGCGTGGTGTGSAGTPTPSPGRSGAATAVQASVTSTARNSIPANYLGLYQSIGQRYSVPWAVLAGIGEVETDHGRSTLPGVHSGANSAGAAGPMQIGIGGAAGDTWGGA
ncbi:MAG TPA: hypothetical protein VGS19_26340, partial [Streptosporangiaceae bacterium]|nr:hypothetical protein [Streptosporangiaceae bacterium]